MRTAISTLMLLAAFVAGPAPAKENGTAADRMAWLAGTWQRTGLPAGQSGYERWTRDADGGFSGLGVSKRGDKTVFEEKLRIVAEGDAVYYVAEVPQNPAPVRFRLIESGSDSAVFENPEHDFPKRIEYRRQGDRLHARISAGGKAMAFEFERAP